MTPLLGRRWFLRGAGGVALSIPGLASLLHGRQADAQGVPVRRFVQFCTRQGSIRAANMWPTTTAPAETMTYAGRDVSRFELPLQTLPGGVGFSPALTASPSVLTPALAAKINVIRGIDVPYWIGHHCGFFLGNPAMTLDGTPDCVLLRGFAMPTIDQVMAYSPAFHAVAPQVRQRSVVVSINMGEHRGLPSWGYANPTAGTGPIQPVLGTTSAQRLFDNLLAAGTPTPTGRPIVDVVLEDYRRLRNSDRRLSAEDRLRLDEHIQRVAEIQKRIALGGKACAGAVRPATDTVSALTTFPALSDVAALGANQIAAYRTINDILASAFACNTTRVAVVYLDAPLLDGYSGGKFHQTAHADSGQGGLMTDPTQQAALVEAGRRFFALMLDLASKLDRPDSSGRTMLDNSLLVWMQEHGAVAHSVGSIPIVTVGGAGGALRTGRYVSYGGAAPVAGLTMNQWYATALQAMGVPRAEYERAEIASTTNGTKLAGAGYGVRHANSVRCLPDSPPSCVASQKPTSLVYPSAVLDAAGDMLPFLGA